MCLRSPHSLTKFLSPFGRTIISWGPRNIYSAILCVVLIPQSGDSSGAILGVRSVALLHASCSPYAQFLSHRRTLPWLETNNIADVISLPIGGRAYPVRHYPIAIRLRTRKGCAILCIALLPQSGDSSGAILGVRSVALLHASCSPYYSVARRICAFFGTPLPLKGGFPPKKVEVVAK